jgi:AraC-like DNA-binding protein/mannose-6-phosphate isomerase-like protein (cupin superfamily)
MARCTPLLCNCCRSAAPESLPEDSSAVVRKANQKPAVVDMPAWGVSVFESHHAADFRMEATRHHDLEVFYVLDGVGDFELGGRATPCAAGDVVVVSVNLLHRIADDPGRPLSLHGVRLCPDLWRKSDPGLEGLLPGGRLARNRLISAQVRAEFRRLLFEQTCQRPGFPAMMAGIALQLLTLLARSRGPAAMPAAPHLRGGSTHLQTVEAYVAELERRFFEPVKLASIVKQLGMSRRRFTDLFREATGSTWSDYVRKLRVAHAKQLLVETSRSIMSIAFEVGFEDLSSFYRAFQNVEGVSPQRWRQQQNGR